MALKYVLINCVPPGAGAKNPLKCSEYIFFRYFFIQWGRTTLTDGQRQMPKTRSSTGHLLTCIPSVSPKSTHASFIRSL